jgi:SAM-dependent methyltransferase
VLNNRGSPFDSLASEYDAWFEQEGRLVFDIEVRAFQQILPLLPRPWLEVGVGSGRFAQALGIETGIDPSVKLLETAKKRGITGFLARGEEKFFEARTFGTVFLIVTLCFVSSPAAVLKECRRILQEHGEIVLGLVLRDSPWGQHYLAKKKQGHRFYSNATFYSYQEIVKLLEQSGFVVEKVVSTLFQKPDEVTEMEPPRQGFHPKAGFTIVAANKITLTGRNCLERQG